MNSIRVLLLTLLLCPLLIGAQMPSVTVSTNVIQPASPFLAQLADGGQLNITLINRTQVPLDLKLSPRIEMVSPRQFSIALNPAYQPAQPIPLGPGQTLILDRSSLQRIFGNFRDGNLALSNISLSELQVNGNYKLPEGQYRVCFTAYRFDDAAYANPLSIPEAGCGFMNQCYQAKAPQLLTPVNVLSLTGPNEVKTVAPAPLVAFSWTPPTSTCGVALTGLTYDLDIFLLNDGQIPADAVRNPPVLQKMNLTAPTFPFQETINPGVLQKGKKYVARVRAQNSNRAAGLEIDNNGYSQPVAFLYDAPSTPVLDVPITALPVNACNGVIAPTNTTPIANGTTLKDQEVTIGGFKMKITSIAQNGSSYSGQGEIFWRPLITTLRLSVKFTGLKVNTAKEVYEGFVQTQTTPLKPDWQSLSVVNTTTGMVGVVSKSTAADINDFLNNNAVSKLITKMTGDRVVDFPIGLDREVDGTQVTLAIMGITFSPKGSNMTVLFNMNIPEDNGWLSLAGTNFCIKPDGFNFEKGSLYLPEDKVINIGSGDKRFQMTFKAAKNGPADSTTGTYLNWGKNGIEFVLANAEMALPRTAVVPENSLGKPADGPLTVKLKFNFLKWSDWVASAVVPNFQLTEVPDFSIRASTIYFDHSTVRNAPNMSYPEGYGGFRDANFEGLWIDKLQVLLPADFKTFNSGANRTEFEARHLIIDRSGLSAALRADNVIDLSTGSLGGWSYSLRKINVLIVHNTFSQGAMEGDFRLPVSNDPLSYTGVLINQNRPETPDKGMFYQFTVKPPTAGYKVDLWKAEMRIDHSSVISVARDAFGAGIKAELNGVITLDIQRQSGGVAALLPGLKFEKLGLGNRETVAAAGGGTEVKNQFYFRHGTWKFSSPPKSVAGFPVTINGIEPVYQLTGATTSSVQANVGLKFNVNLNVGFGESSVVSATTALRVTGRIGVFTDKAPEFGFDRFAVERVVIKGDVGPVKVEGALDFYDNHATYGDGMKGRVSAVFPMAKLEATAQFGSVNNYNYWFVDACGAINPPVPLGGAFQIAGFGGGAYHNMSFEQSSLPSPGSISALGAANAAKLDGKTPGETVSGIRFVPSQGTSGMRAALVFSMAPGPDAFNARITLTAQMHNGGIDQLNLRGDAFAITNYPENSKPRVKGTIDMTFNFRTSEFNLTGRLEAELASAKVVVPLNVYAGKGWYFKLGDPQGERASLTLIDVNTSLLKAYLGATAYFNAGAAPAFNLILPDLPPEVQKYGFGRDASIASLLESFNRTPGSGFGFGARVDGDFKARFLIFYASLRFIVGLDMALKKFNQPFECNGAVAGLNGWYGLGQLYAYVRGEAGVHVDVWFFEGDISLCKIEAGAALQAGFPSPTWATGTVFISGEVLGGLLSFSTNFEMRIGERCYPTPDPLGDLKIIAQVGPTSAGNAKADIYDIPFAVTNMSLNEPYPIPVAPTEAKPNGETRVYKFEVTSFQVVNQRTGQPVDATYLAVEPDGTNVKLRKANAFDPNSTYSARVVAVAREWDGANWVDPYFDKEKRRKPMMQEENFTFSTGEGPASIPADQVEYTFPIDRQRHVLKNDAGTGTVQLHQWPGYLFQNKNVFVYFINNNLDTVRSTCTANGAMKRLDFPIPAQLRNKDVYRVEFWTEDKAPEQQQPGGFGQHLPRNLPTIASRLTVSTRLVRYEQFGATKLVRSASGIAQLEKRAPVFTMFFGTSAHNSLQEKLAAQGTFFVNPASSGLELSTRMGVEKFEQFDLVGFRNNQGREYAPLLFGFVRWDDSKGNDRFASTNIYANYYRLRGLGIQIDFGSNSARLLNTAPLFALDNRSDYDRPLSQSELPWPLRLSSAGDGTSLYRYATTAQAAVRHRPMVMTIASSNPIFPAAYMSVSAAVLPMTSRFVWEREAILRQDFELVKRSAGAALYLIQSYSNFFNASRSYPYYIGNPTMRLAGNSQGGSVECTLEALFNISKDPSSMGLLQQLNNMTFQSYPRQGTSRQAVFRYVRPGVSGPEVVKSFTY
ncbi:hypothetical protein [Flaviaesturariibacter amylovorans]|uniref:T9SS type A sorting domain-containing protein n=1 Tax=Flaviaesturariibacter amylovorans TaxID=1084520 RepID=A0ABP8GG00_9BACT